jgi:hypothetical protein
MGSLISAMACVAPFEGAILNLYRRIIMRQFVFIIASVAMWSLVTPPAWCQQASGANQGAGQTGSQSGASASSANQASPGGTNQNVVPQNQPHANPGNPPGTAAPQGAQPGQTGSADNLQRRALDQQQHANQQLSEQQQLNQQQLNQRSQFQRNQFDPRAKQGRSAARQGFSRFPNRATAVDSLRQMIPQFDDWRMVERDGRFWYWTPERNWMYFNNGNWSAYDAGMANRQQSLTTDNLTFPTGLPRDDWRAVHHNGRWWYWTPDESWMYLHAGRWNALRDQSTALRRERLRQRYGVGYRGPDGQLLDGQRRSGDPAEEQNFNDSRTGDQSQRMMFDGPDANQPFMQPGQDAEGRQPIGQDQDASVVPPAEPQPPAQGDQQSPQSQNGQSGQIDSNTPLGTNANGSGIGPPDQQSSQPSE